MSMRISRTYIDSIAIGLSFFIFSIIFSNMYYSGDQIAYGYFYDNVSKFSFLDAVAFYKNSLDSQEPLYFILVYLFSSLFDKNFLFSVLNALLASSIYLLLKKINVSKFIIAMLGCNFYLYVLFFSAERLKVSFLFLVLSFLFDNKILSRLSILLSILTHVQTLLLILLAQYKRFDNFLFRIKRLRLGYLNSDFITLISVFILTCLFTMVMWGHLSHKAMHYYSNMSSVSAIIKPLIFTLISIPYAKNKYQALFVGGTVMLVSIFFGSERLVIFSYLVFLYYALSYNNGFNFWVVLTSAYFSVKGIMFLMSIYYFGDGFVSLDF
ncbi:hypothetical protein [Vibrio cholerae]|uniref:hypothetical protein n=1 Tax=Vibrio cholerae TaxID=666 RepID=UPI0011DC5787|nr:hypothetical protein [Vibrio cholerae]TXY51719.1 hypothetical protein FXE77_01565 [Vibrio cholerae]